MTAISALNSASYLNAPPPYVGPAAVASNQSTNPSTPDAGAPQSSTIVSVGASNTASPSQTYYFPDTPSAVATAVPPIWQQPPGDAVSLVMASNYLSPSLGHRINGLGSALLNFIKGGGSNFSQSVMQGVPASEPASEPGSTSEKPAAVAASSAPVLSNTTAEDKLTIQTKSGVKVEISLESLGNMLSVDVKSSGDLSDAERAAIGKLSDGFQAAINGLGADTMKLDLSGLTQFDPTVLSSVDLHTETTPVGQATQTIDFHADNKTRTVNVAGPAGALKVNVDMSNPASWGNAQQQADAMNNALKQIDQAAIRGQGDASLVAMFKDAFTEMNSNYVAPSPLQRVATSAPLTDVDHAMLTGLADFNASITQSAKASNPMHLDELDTFSYQASQKTNVRGNSTLDRSVSQDQQSHLTASYHASLVPDLPLQLSTLRSSQNYYFKQIDDSADSNVGVSYYKGDLTKASLTQSASQSTHTSKYEMAELVDDTTTPLQAQQTKDILATLKPLMKKDQSAPLPADKFEWQQALSKTHDAILLQSDPLGLQGN